MVSQPLTNSFRELPLFSECKEQTLRELSEEVYEKSLEYYHHLDFPGQGEVLVIRQGQMKLVSRPGRRKKIILILKPGDILGLNTLIRDGKNPFTAYALSEVKFWAWNSDVVGKCLSEDSRFMRAALRSLMRRTNRIDERISNLEKLNVKERLLIAVRELKEDFGLNSQGYLNIRLTMNDWADYVAAPIPDVYEAFEELEERRLVNFE